MKFEPKMMKQLTLNDNECKIINDMESLLEEILSNFADCANIYNVDTNKFMDYPTLNLILSHIKECFDDCD